MTTQQNSQVIRADADGDVVYDKAEGLIFVKAFEWSGSGKTVGDQLILTDGSGNEVWRPSVGVDSETNERTFNVPLAIPGLILQAIPAGVLLVYKE